jgi:flagellar biosynthesis/type III secretory pathway protein FliH
VSVVPPEPAPAAALPQPSPAAARDDRPAPQPQPAAAESPTPEPAAPPSATATDFWATDAGRELKADRGRIEAVLGQIASAVADVRQDRKSRIQEWQRAAVELALTIATRLLHERVVTNEFPVDAKVRDMIAQLGADVPVTVGLNPADLKLLTDRLGGEPLAADRDDPRFVADPALDRGAVRVEGRESMLVSDVSRELEEIRDELLRSLGNARS